MWVGNLICCWQLVQWVFHLRSFDDKHAEIQGRAAAIPERSIGGHTKNSAWYRRMLAQASGLQVSRGDRMTEMVSPDDGHSLGGTTLQDEKKHAIERAMETNWSVVNRPVLVFFVSPQMDSRSCY